MPSAELSPSADRWYRARAAALAKLLRMIRHEMATPLSGALLHVEVVRRTLQKAKFETPELEANVRAVQEGLDDLAGLLEAIGDRVTGTSEPALFSGREIVQSGARRHEERGTARGVSLGFFGPDTAGPIFGCAGELEDAVADVTAFALDHAAPGTPVEWTTSGSSSEISLSCRFEGSLPAERLEGILGAWRLSGSDDLARRSGLLFARWAVEAQGGRLALVRNGNLLEARAAFPAVEQ